MITFNGLKYLPEQLDSILAQSRIVDHIVVSDDRSTDGTWEYLQAWASRSPVSVTLLRNEVQLGLSGNIEQAIRAVDADIIFTADQDDIWFADKVATVCAVFEQDPQVQLVHTDAILVDGQGRDLGRRLLKELSITAAEYAAIRSGTPFQLYCRRNVVTGATAAVRKSLVEQALPLPAGFYHDAWLAFFSLAIGTVHLIEAPLISYRQHGANLVGVKKLGVVGALRRLWWKLNTAGARDKLLAQISAQQTVLHSRLSAYPGTPSAFRNHAANALRFTQARQALPGSYLTRATRVLRQAAAGRYQQFSHESRTNILRDLLGR